MTPPASLTWLSESLSRIRGARVGVYGDFYLDAYWRVDPEEAERSSKAGLPVRRVREQRYSLGGAGNIAANLAALGVNAVHTTGVIGDDMMGRHMLDLMKEQGIRSDGMLRIQRDWQTPAEGRPCIGEPPAQTELNRIEFGAFNCIAELTMERLVEALDRTAAWCDIVVLHQQAPEGASPPAMVDRINRIIARHARCRFIVDSRHRAELYRGAMLKLNTHEAAGVCGQDLLPGQDDGDSARRYAAQLYRQTGRAVFITQAERGIIVADATGLHESPIAPIPGPIDATGAGDTVAATLAAVLGGGGDTVTAARLANLAARVTVRKLHTTGTATPDEIRQAAAEIAGP